MKQKPLVNLLGYAILLGICCIGSFARSTLLVSIYILLLFVISSYRIHLWIKSPKSERHVYFSWRTAILLHPISQSVIIILFIFVDITAILTGKGRP